MYSNALNKTEKSFHVLSNIAVVMRLTTIILLSACLQASANAYAQKVTINENNVSLTRIFEEIKKQTGYNFIYAKEDISKASLVTINVKNADVKDVLNKCFVDQPLSYLIKNNIIIVRPALQVPEKKIEVQTIDSVRITGQVTDSATGNPLAGVTIQVKGSSLGIVTSIDGHFSLSVPDDAILVVSYIGYDKKEIPVTGRTSINIPLATSATSLNQLVVTALGIKRDVRSLTSSSQSVEVKDLKKISEPDIMTSLQGKVAGVEITLGGQEIGSPARVVIRGNRSISGDSQPLYIIDGVPILGDPTNLNQNNISSINVLKGPSAAALYGSEAQNGVIIITTKTGVAGVNSTSLSSNFTLRTPVLSYPFQNEYAQGTNGTYDAHSDLSWGPKMEGQMVDNWSLDPKDKGTQYALTPQPNNLSDFFRTGKIWTNSLDITRGGQNVQGAFSYTNVYGEGIAPNNSLRRNNLSLRISSDLLGEEGNGPLKLDGKISYTHESRIGKIQGGGFQGLTEGLYTMPRNIKVSQMKNFEFTDSTGANRQNYWVHGSIWDENPYWRAYRNVSSSTLNRVTGFMSLKYDFTTNLSLQVRGSYDGEYNSGDLKLYNDTYNTAQFGRYTVTQNDSYLLNSDFLLSYRKVYQKWKFDVNAGGSLRKNSSSANSVNTGQAMVIPNFFTLSNTLLPVIDYQTKSTEATRSLYAFGHFSFKDDIYIDISGRNDWSSTLPVDHSSYFYPSLGISAILSDLIPAFPKWFSFLKIEASGSQVGSGAQPYMLERTATFSPGGYNGFIILDNVLPDENLKPEISRSYEAGVETRFFDDRLGLDLTVYKTNTFNQLFTVDLPIGSGATSFYTNGGNVQNTGIEAILNATVIHTENFRWSFDVNFSANRNKVLKINDQRPKVQVGQITIEQGQPYGNIYGRGFVRDSAGSVIVGSNGIPEVTPGNTVLIANFNPDWLGSISSTVAYKNLSLSISIDHRQGGTMLSDVNARLYGDGQAQATVKGRDGGLIFGTNFFANQKAVLEDGHVNNIPITAEEFWQSMGGRNDIVGELFSVSATNTRLRSLALTYALPFFKPGMLISNIELSLVGRNLFFIQRASKTVDPDLKIGTGPDNIGISSFTLPTIRSFGVNVKVDFK